MGDSVPLRLDLPALKYPIGKEPKEKKKTVNQHSTSVYIPIVEKNLTAAEFERVKEVLGPIMRLSSRSDIKLSGKTVYSILARSIVTDKKNEAWFHFAAQPMRFSIREFHMVTGLKCDGDVEGPEGESERFEWELLEGRTHHTLSDVMRQLKKTKKTASDERVCLAILLLVESIVLPKNNNGTFPLEYVNKAKNVAYPWGRDAYLVLLKSIKKAVAKHLEGTSSFELQGYPLAFNIWILESIPLLRDKFSTWTPTVNLPGVIYLCEKYTEVQSPSLMRVVQFEADRKLKVTCILPSIPHDPEDDVSLEDEHSDELESVKDISKKGYKFKADDWENRFVDTLETLDALIHMTEYVENSQTPASIQEDSVNNKLNKIVEVMTENVKSMKDRMSLLEAENMELRARVSELEGNQNVAQHTQTPVFPTNVTQQQSGGKTLSPTSPQPETQEFSPNLPQENVREQLNETPSLQTQEFSPNLTRENVREQLNETPSLQTQEFSPNLTRENVREQLNETPSLQTQEFTPNLTRENVREQLNETPSFQTQELSLNLTRIEQLSESPSLQTQELSPNLPRESGKEQLNVTPSLQTQFFSPNSTAENDPEQSYDTPSNANQKENLSKGDDIEPTTVIISPNITKVGADEMNETPASPITPQSIETQVLTPVLTQQVGADETNETPASPIASQSIETQVFTPNQTQHNVTEGTYDSTEPLTEIISPPNKEPSTEIISVTNKKEDTLQKTHYSPVSSLISRVIEETKLVQTSASSSLSTLFENGADVEITASDDSTCRIWYPGNVSDTKMCDGVEKVTVTLFEDQNRVTVIADKIRPKPPADDREKKFEMMDNVEAFYSKGWGSGQVRMILDDDTYSIYLNSSLETLTFKASNLRVHREWLDGVWKMADEMPPGYFKGIFDSQNQNPSQQEIKEKPDTKRNAADGSSQESGIVSLNTYLRQSERVLKRSRKNA